MGIFWIFKKCRELLLGVKMSYRGIKKRPLTNFDAIMIFAMKLKIGHVFVEKSKNEFEKKNMKIFIDDHSKIFFFEKFKKNFF